MNLTNAVALITGGSAGIGRSIAQELAASGARVAITGRDKGRIEEAAQTLGVFAIQADVTDESDVIRTYREVLAKFGDLGILVNNPSSGPRMVGPCSGLSASCFITLIWSPSSTARLTNLVDSETRRCLITSSPGATTSRTKQNIGIIRVVPQTLRLRQ
jgi:NAD(P)-dependent dehydrogenase (short-subunit alcohol dehydrogenase family)